MPSNHLVFCRPLLLPSSIFPGIRESKGLARVFVNTTVHKHPFFGAQFSFILQLSHPYMTTGKTIVLKQGTFVGKVMSLLFNKSSRLASLVAQRVKRLPAMQETWVRSLGQEDAQEKKMATHSSTLA